MSSSLLEETVFIFYFFSLFTILMTVVPHIYKFMDITSDDSLLIILFWGSLFILFGLWIKYIRDKRVDESIKTK